MVLNKVLGQINKHRLGKKPITVELNARALIFFLESVACSKYGAGGGHEGKGSSAPKTLH
jgi:hypothetical protein